MSESPQIIAAGFLIAVGKPELPLKMVKIEIRWYIMISKAFKKKSEDDLKRGRIMRPLIKKTALMITDCMDVKMGLKRMTKDRWEYKMLDHILTDDMARICLAMGVRKPTTPEALAKKMDWPADKVQDLLDEMAQIGIIEYNRHNKDRHKQYVLPIFVVGSAENLILNEELMEEFPETADFFYEMSLEPLKLIGGMVPPGGAGLGFHVIPLEKAIPKDSQAVEIEYLSYWLDKYEKQLAVMPCVCRTTMIAKGGGCGEIPDETCISVGDYSDYLVETGKARRATKEEVLGILKRAEENGYMHQITNGDGGEDIFAICNCSVGNCFALRCSQYFNNPNASASCFQAKVDPERCVACGRCAEVCPAGAVKLGKRLCTKEGPPQYPTQTLPSEKLLWTHKDWNPNYRNDNKVNTYAMGTSPCKAYCPAHTSVQGVMKLMEKGHILPALKLLRYDNPFPSMCKEACDHPCQRKCTRGKVDEPMEIVDTMALLAEKEEEYKDKLLPVKSRMWGRDSDHLEKIAVDGEDYDALSCAWFLALKGYRVDLFAENLPCNDAERYLMEQLGVNICSGKPDKLKYDAVYPLVFKARADTPAGKMECGREAAESIHRLVQPGHDQSLARDPRHFSPMNREDLALSPEMYKDHKCLGCGVSRVDPNRCIGCGICTTRCMFGAIKLERNHPEYLNYVPYEKAKINTALNGMKQMSKVAVKKAVNIRKKK